MRLRVFKYDIILAAAWGYMQLARCLLSTQVPANTSASELVERKTSLFCTVIVLLHSWRKQYILRLRRQTKGLDSTAGTISQINWIDKLAARGANKTQTFGISWVNNIDPSDLKMIAPNSADQTSFVCLSINTRTHFVILNKTESNLLLFNPVVAWHELFVCSCFFPLKVLFVHVQHMHAAEVQSNDWRKTQWASLL